MNKVLLEIIKNDWITQREVLNILNNNYKVKISKRKLQEHIKINRELYKKRLCCIMIVKSNKGYKASQNTSEITKCANELIKTGASMVNEGKSILQSLEARNV